MAMSCPQAANIADGREIWKMNETPSFQRWENDDSKICQEEHSPWIQKCNGKRSYFFNLMGNSLKSFENDKCIGIKRQELE